MKLNRQTFWNLYHKYFDAYSATTQKTVDALNTILDRFETETRLTNVAQFAYVLATAFHESGINGNHFVPVKEGRERTGAKGRRNQDRYWFTGFYGRGLIQTTWEEKYLALGKLLGVGDKFVKNPDLLLEIGWAYEALVAGMVSGIYRKDSKGRHTLRRHLKTDDASTAEYIESREIVNGDKKKNGGLIAGYAQHFETILIKSKVPAAVPAFNQPKDSPSNASDAQTFDSPAAVETPNVDESSQPEPPLDNFGNTLKDFGEQIDGFVEEKKDEAEGKLSKTEESVTRTIETESGKIEKTVSEITDKFDPKNIPAFIPRFGKQWFLSLIPGGGFVASLLAKFNELPDWFIYGLVFFAGITTVLFFQLIMKHREKVLDFITNCYKATADPAMHNLIPTPAKEYVGYRRNELFNALSDKN